MTQSIAVSEETLEKLKKVSTATLTTQLFKRGYKQQFLVGLKPLSKSFKTFVGEAFTLRFIPAREDMDNDLGDLKTRGEKNLQWEAVEQVAEGQVLVVDSREDPRAASAGNMLVTRLMRRGASGIVTDGALRDGYELAEMPFPAYCQETTASTRPAYHRAIDMQVPIACAQVAVYPGDIIAGDQDGVVVIPRHIAEELANDSYEQELREQFLFTKIDAGAPLWGTYPPNEETLKEYEAYRKEMGV
ncbi:ribonuclease activity regulator RraA [Kangiella sp.]|uniref:ribonuclease activity regulator RraA n=1 Tax=Kangiella sp. TaxID=1920245 RepID=UPI003A8EAB9D